MKTCLKCWHSHGTTILQLCWFSCPKDGDLSCEWQEEHCALELPALNQLGKRSQTKAFSGGICCFPLCKGFCGMRTIPNSQAFCRHPYQWALKLFFELQSPCGWPGDQHMSFAISTAARPPGRQQTSTQPPFFLLCPAISFAALCKMKIILMGEL